jgi:ABC-type sugar transport system ATPase subunit
LLLHAAHPKPKELENSFYDSMSRPRQVLPGFRLTLGFTSTYLRPLVTHDQEEALELADRVIIRHEGHIQQVGSPTQLRENPKNEFVADFLDCVMI